MSYIMITTTKITATINAKGNTLLEKRKPSKLSILSLVLWTNFLKVIRDTAVFSETHSVGYKYKLYC